MNWSLVAIKLIYFQNLNNFWKFLFFFMKNIIFILFIYLFFTYGALSQHGEIKYKTYISIPSTEPNADIKDFILKIHESANSQEFTLRFNKNISNFNISSKTNEINENQKFIYNSARAGYTSFSEVYFDKQSNTIYEVMNDGVITKDTLNIQNWNITKESKNIDKYTCYKALYSFEFLSRKGEKLSRVITAWFAPSLPYSFGPKTFNGLPGLILELTEKKTTYLVSSILLNDNEVKLDLPKGKTITRKEYEAKISENLGTIISKTIQKN